MVSGLPSAIAGSASPGGNLLASVQIGSRSRNKMTCASACALIWLAGARRYVWDTAKIGFHGAFDAVTMEGSGPGNAIVGAYLNKLGLSYQAIVYMTAASPTDMRWLHSDDAKRWGVAAENFGTEWKLKSEAVTFVMNFFNQWSVLTGAKLMSALAISYADNVEYNGAKKLRPTFW